MAYVAVNSWGVEEMFHNRPERTENRYWQDNIVYWEIREHTTCADDYSIELPKGTIKKLIGKNLTWDDEPVELKSNYDTRRKRTTTQRPYNLMNGVSNVFNGCGYHEE